MVVPTRSVRAQVSTLSGPRIEGLGVLAVLGGMAALTMLRDPHVPGNLGICPSLLLFGVYCPGCGSLRGIHDLIHGDVAAAAGHNLLLIPALIFVLGWAVRAVARPHEAGTHQPVASPTPGSPRGRLANAPASVPAASAPGSPRGRLARVPWVWLLLVVIVVYTLLRNLPGSPLAP